MSDPRSFGGGDRGFGRDSRAFDPLLAVLRAVGRGHLIDHR